MADYRCVIIEFAQFDVAVPLVCRQCGNCCRKCYVPIEPESLPEIAEVLGKPIRAIQDRLNEGLESYRQGNPSDCCFLAESRCLIHQVRPEACRQFPSFTDAAAGKADCPAHREHKRIERLLCRQYQEVQIRLPSSCKAPRPAPGGEWDRVLSIVKKANISEMFFQEFLALNRITENR